MDQLLHETRITSGNCVLNSSLKCLEIVLKTHSKGTFIPEKHYNSKTTKILCYFNLKFLPLSLSLIRKIDSTLSRFRKNTELSLLTVPLTAMVSSSKGSSHLNFSHIHISAVSYRGKVPDKCGQQGSPIFHPARLIGQRFPLDKTYWEYWIPNSHFPSSFI